MNNYLLENTDPIVIKNETKNLIKKNNFEGSQVSIYDIEEVPLEKALEDLDTYGFLSSKKVVIIKNIDILKYDENKKDLDHLFKYLENSSSDNLLIIEVKKLDNKTKISKELKKKCNYIESSLNTKSFIKGQLKGYDISQDTINLLDEYCLEDITKIYNECEKLKEYRIDEKKITSQDVRELVVRKQGDTKETTFQFSRALAEKNKKEALNLFNSLLEKNNDSIAIVGLLASQLRIIYQVKILEERNMSDREIASTLGEKEFRIKKTRELTRLYSRDELNKLIITLSDIDLKMKTTDIDPKHLIQMFIINL
mgnify:FL=1